MEKKLKIDIKKYRGTTSVVSARLPQDLIKVIDKIAHTTGYNRNEVILLCLEYAVKNVEISKGDAS